MTHSFTATIYRKGRAKCNFIYYSTRVLFQESLISFTHVTSVNHFPHKPLQLKVSHNTRVMILETSMIARTWLHIQVHVHTASVQPLRVASTHITTCLYLLGTCTYTVYVQHIHVHVLVCIFVTYATCTVYIVNHTCPDVQKCSTCANYMYSIHNVHVHVGYDTCIMTSLCVTSQQREEVCRQLESGGHTDLLTQCYSYNRGTSTYSWNDKNWLAYACTHTHTHTIIIIFKNRQPTHTMFHSTYSYTLSQTSTGDYRRL